MLPYQNYLPSQVKASGRKALRLGLLSFVIMHARRTSNKHIPNHARTQVSKTRTLKIWPHCADESTTINCVLFQNGDRSSLCASKLQLSNDHTYKKNVMLSIMSMACAMLSYQNYLPSQVKASGKKALRLGRLSSVIMHGRKASNKRIPN